MLLCNALPVDISDLEEVVPENIKDNKYRNLLNKQIVELRGKSELVAQKLTRLMKLSRCVTTINDLCVDFAKLHVCCKMFKKIKSNVYVKNSLKEGRFEIIEEDPSQLNDVQGDLIINVEDL